MEVRVGAACLPLEVLPRVRHPRSLAQSVVLPWQVGMGIRAVSVIGTRIYEQNKEACHTWLECITN